MTLQDVPPEKIFWLNNGKQIKNVMELAKELSQMSEETFNHHVNEQKNDFANWIEACVKDNKLAMLVLSTKDRARMTAIVERHIQDLTNPPKAKPEKTAEEKQKPKIIKAGNITQLALRSEEPETVLKPEKKPAKIDLIEEHRKKIVHTPFKTLLSLTHGLQHDIHAHKTRKHRHTALLLASHVILGIAVGGAIIIVLLA